MKAILWAIISWNWTLNSGTISAQLRAHMKELLSGNPDIRRYASLGIWAHRAWREGKEMPCGWNGYEIDYLIHKILILFCITSELIFFFKFTITLKDVATNVGSGLQQGVHDTAQTGYLILL